MLHNIVTGSGRGYPYMENCYYQGRSICTFELKDESGYYREELVLEWKQAAAERRLTCMECGAHVYLAAGMIKEPYFAHYDLVDCDYGEGHETEELKKGKRLLYSLLKRSFPEGEVAARYRMANGMYSTLYCRTGLGRDIAVDYRLQNNSLEKFLERDAYYQGEKLIRIYLLGAGQDKENKQLDWYQNLLQNAMGYVALLDTDRESLILKMSISYRIGAQRKFKQSRKSYPLKELTMNQDGWMKCDFMDECNRINRAIELEKENYRLEQEKNHRLKELDPVLLAKCRRMIEEGNAHLVSKKYYDAIMDIPVE
jgi:competence CoiA-like predicted nuclease